MIKIEIKHKHNDVSGWYEVSVKMEAEINSRKLQNIKETLISQFGRAIDNAIDNQFKSLISEETTEEKPDIYEI